MREVAEAIADDIRERFPQLKVEVLPFTPKRGWVVRCMVPCQSKRWDSVKVLLFSQRVELWESSEIRSVVLPWELPDLFDIVDDALEKLVS